MRKVPTPIVLAALLSLAFTHPTHAAVEVIPFGSTWKYLLGTAEASTPVGAWRVLGFNDTSWTDHGTPLGYGEPVIVPPELPTSTAGNYLSVFCRKTFSIPNPNNVVQLTLTLNIDDGVVVWINGVEVGRDTFDPAGEPAFNSLATAAVEPHEVVMTISSGLSSLLLPGNNQLAIQLFNGSSTSSDLLLDARLTYLEPDPIPPFIQDVSPAPGILNQLTQVTVTFSEAVTGVDASDLVINGSYNATSVAANGNAYTFLIAQPPFGVAQFAFNPAHGIADQALPPNPFDHTAPAASWQYTLVDIFPPLIAATIPSAGSTVKTLAQIQVRFNEGVSGVDASDLRINTAAATGLTQISPSEYVFAFTEPPVGTVSVAWDPGHGITDLSPNANAFAGGSWNYNLDPNASSGGVVISEFLVSNGPAFPGDTASLMDEDGEFQDWIEIYNAGATTVNLLNWSLTDKKSNLNQWRFPGTNILSGEFMVVFASSKDRKVPGAPLHTSFGLNTTGEYLALVRPDGTIATEFDPYPQQLRNVSHGYGFSIQSFTLIPASAPRRYLVPADGSLGDNWKMPAFGDQTWAAASGAIGYDTQQQDPAEDSIPASVLGQNPAGYWRFSEASGTTAANSGSLGAAANGVYGAGIVLGQAGPRPPAQDGFEANNTAASFNGATAITTTSQVVNNRSAFTMCGWIRPMGTQAARTGLFGQNDAIEFGFINATTLQIWTPGGGTIDVPYGFPAGEWHHIAVVGDGTSLRVYRDGALGGQGGSATGSYGSSAFNFNIGGGGIFDTSGNFFNGFIDEVAVFTRALSAQEIFAHFRASGGSSINYDTLVQTDVETAMHGVNSSLFLRIPFQVADASLVDRIFMNVRYDDGFKAFLNGVEVAARNAPAAPAWDAAATDRHADTSAIVAEEINISTFASELHSGDNVLAIQALNIDENNTDFLIDATLNALSAGELSSNARYFVTPTPGEPNGAGTEDIGPVILEVSHAPAVLDDSQNLTVTARVVQAFSPVSTFVLHYRVMFGATATLNMVDNGQGGDQVAGDGIFTGTIPAAGISVPGDMIRYYLTATDTAGNASRWPLFEDASVGGSQEYLGTMVRNPAVTSKIPIYEFFVESTQLAAIDTEGGGRMAVFHDGELYDNVYMELRGNTTAGYAKKSHRLEFPREHRLRHEAGDFRVRDTSFTADFGDPTYMRQGLTFWLATEFGAPGPFYYPVRLQMNGAFYQLANHNNVIRGEILEPLGYDERGALYQAAGQINTAQSSTGNFRKRTRLNENNADYQAMAGGIAESVPLATRETNVFDMLDVPEVLNYLVVGRWVHENDDVWANMTVYRDTEGDRLWRIIPFDMNLSWGAIYYEGGMPAVIEGVQATNDTHKAFPMYGSSQAPALNSANFNRIYDVIFDVPRTREMFLRRMRTMMDTYVKPPGTHPLLLPFERRILALRDLILEEALRDRARWNWPPKGGQTNFDPGIGPVDGVDQMIRLFVGDRRNHFYVKHSVNNTALAIGTTKDSNAGIPNAQPTDAVVEIGGFLVNPSGGNQNEEYICLTNKNTYAVDISGWRLDGAVDFTFKPGTVVPSRHVLYVSPNVNAFRARATSPRAGQGHFVVGNYQGHLSDRGESIELFDSHGRGVHTNTYPGNPSEAQRYLRVTEIMYNPAPAAGGGTDAQSFEYIELKNIGPSPLSLAGVKFTVGITFSFSGGTLNPEQTIVLVRDSIGFVSRYGSGHNVGGIYNGLLDSSGERLVLVDAKNEEILDFSYNNAWYPITDGNGFALQIVDEDAEPDLWSDKTNWRPSGAWGGTPAAADPGAPVIAPILVNEILTHTDLPDVDAVELYNPNGGDINIGGWFLTDDFLEPLKYRIPNGTIIPAGLYLVLDENDFNPDGLGPLGFSFSSHGDQVFLFSGTPAGTALTGYFHGYEFGAAKNGVTFGPHLTSTGVEKFVALASPTMNAPNAGPKVGPVVISEIMYRPPDVNGEDNDLDEFIELHNISGAAVPLYDPANVANTWQLRDAVTYAFPSGASLNSGAFLLVVGFDTNDTALLNAFKLKYSVPAQVKIYGPFQGKLDNSADEVELYFPDTPEPDLVPYVLADKVNYEDLLPWPEAADGTGPSLQKLHPSDFGNDPIAWHAAAPTAGSAASDGLAPTITAEPVDKNAIALSQFTLNVGATGDGPLHYQWRFNGDNIAGATTGTLTLNDVLPEQAGLYSVVVYNRSGARVSREAHVDVVLAALFVSHPRPTSVVLGGTATFTVEVFSSTPLSYQWRRNGVPIPGATSKDLVINPVQRSDDALYDVVVTDAVAPVTSQAARLTVLVVPAVVVRPLTQTVTVGGTATFSIVTDGTLPMGYRWRRGTSTLLNEVINSSQSFLTVNNVQTAQAGAYSVVLTNEAFFTPGTLISGFSLVVVADTDGDGLSDTFEASIGFNSNDPADAAVDRDGDGMSEIQELLAGTNPTDPSSYLKVQSISDNDGVNIEFAAATNRTYMIQFKDNLDDPSWSKLSEVAASPLVRTVVVKDALGTGTRYYRLATPRSAN